MSTPVRRPSPTLPLQESSSSRLLPSVSLSPSNRQHNLVSPTRRQDSHHAQMYAQPQALPTPVEYRVYVRPELFVHGSVVSSSSKWTLRKLLDYLHDLFIFINSSTSPFFSPSFLQPTLSAEVNSDVASSDTTSRSFRLTRQQWLAFTKLRSSPVTANTPTTGMLSMSTGAVGYGDPPGTPNAFASPSLRPPVPNFLLSLPSSPSLSARVCFSPSPRPCLAPSPTSAAHAGLPLPDVDVEALWNLLSVLSWHSSSPPPFPPSGVSCLSRCPLEASLLPPSCCCSTCLSLPSSSPTSSPPPTVDIRQLAVLMITQLFRSYLTARRNKDLRFTDAVWSSPQSPVGGGSSPHRDLWADDLRGGGTPRPGDEEGGGYGRSSIGSPLASRSFSGSYRHRGMPSGVWDGTAMDSDAVVSFVAHHVWTLIHITAGGGIRRGDSCGATADEEVDADALNLLEILFGTRDGVSLRDKILQDLGSSPLPAAAAAGCSPPSCRLLISDVSVCRTVV
eukprot:GHVS01029061.1.p1 GENE.GHVS01029061.1~~GHVS01029061.1.p1  ORF type:complete len:505 (-),score=112.05 GHVS01029061.1:1771-3285(-)